MEKIGTVTSVTKQIVEGTIDAFKFNTRGMKVKVPISRVIGQVKQGAKFRLVFKENQPWIHVLEEQQE